MNAYYYTPTYRPATFCTVPAGWELIERGTAGAYPRRLDLPTGDTLYGVLMYRFPLSGEVLSQYELQHVCGTTADKGGW